MGHTEKKKKNERKYSMISSIFMHADDVDILLMVFGFIGSVGDGFGTPLLLLVTSKFMNNLGVGSSGADPHLFLHNINKNAVTLMYMACGWWVACFLEGYCWTKTGERQASKMREKYLKAVLRQDISYFDLKSSPSSNTTTEVITSVCNDSFIVQDVLTEKVPNFLMNCTMFVGSYVTAFLLMWRLALVGFPFVVFLIVPGLIYGKFLMSLSRKMREEYNKAGSIVEQATSSIRSVYSFVGEDKTVAEFSEALDESVKLGLKQGLAKGLALGSNSVSFAIWSFLSWYGSRLVMYHGAQGGTVFAVGAALCSGGLSLGAGLSNVKCFSEACAAGERIMEVMMRIPKIDSDSTKGKILPSISGSIEFKNIEFVYPSRPKTLVLKDFNLDIEAGNTIALVGGSGCGKSTVVSLLQRFYNSLDGDILIDGIKIHEFQLKWLRAQMGLVSQEPALFGTSIKENILFGKEDATMNEVIDAAKAANAHSFICQLTKGYDTQVGERGIQMSGGQKQRIALARALIKAPRILLLDEATSALDSESERNVQEALDKASLGRTTIIIAHRLSTVRNADKIAAVQNGHVMETGSHSELLKLEHGLYSSLVRIQEMTDKRSTMQKEILNGNSMPCICGSMSQSNSKNSLVSPVLDECNNSEKDCRIPPFWRLLALYQPEWKQTLLGCVSSMLFGAVQPFYCLAMAHMIFVYFLNDHSQIKVKTMIYSCIFAGLAIFSFVVNLCQHYNFAVIGEYLTKRIRERMLSKILTFEVGWFDQDENSSGAICSRLAKDANMVRSLVGDRMSLLIQTFSSVIIACAMGLIIAWRLAILIIAVQPLIIVCFYARRVLVKSMYNKSRKAQNESSKLAAEAVSNLRTITSFSSQSRILNMFREAQLENTRLSWIAGLGLGFSQSIITFSWALNFWYGGKLVFQGEMTTKSFLEVFMILISTGRVIAEAGSTTSDLAKGSDAVGSVFTVLDRYTSIEPEDPDGYQPDTLTGQIEFHDVHFAYPTRPEFYVFNGFNLSIEAGKSTGLVGRSGSGKSTIISMIERFYDPSRGTVTIDGCDLKSYHLRSLRKHIGLVSQEPTLFAGTIRENILYCTDHDKIGETEMINAARASNAHNFISGLADGYDTWCGDKGVQLSGGQKQRIAIARSILKNPKILLLDEATSALDNQSEKIVQEALDSLMVNRTTVVVAHRMSSVQNCDFIAVLEEGKVVEKGTHSTLLDKGPSGYYHSLVNLQRS
ncbi:ABC transporter B family member 15-like isoform X2 [Papaver somniferum]|nr:ABC transporter B family member 15-like isoform X1 [Papaver somniferum]XP_026421885.1 ABC transporter B family member 15-like isoform X2 [Papaver somniferum]